MGEAAFAKQVPAAGFKCFDIVCFKESFVNMCISTMKVNIRSRKLLSCIGTYV